MRSPGLEPAPLDPALRDLPLRAYRPRPSVRLPHHEVPRARFPAVDAHNHLGRWLTPDGGWAVRDVDALLADMASCNVDAIVNLDGRWGAELQRNVERYDRAHPGRFATFCHLDRTVFSERGWPGRLAQDLRASAAAGARGVKVWKDLGLAIRDERDELLFPDDKRLAVVWSTAGELRLPIVIHIADPVAFFAPVDEHNERLEELLAHPEWSFADARFPRFERLIDALEGVVAAHPDVTFIGAHVGCFAEDLAWVGRMLSRTRTSTWTSRRGSPSWVVSHARPSGCSWNTRIACSSASTCSHPTPRTRRSTSGSWKRTTSTSTTPRTTCRPRAVGPSPAWRCRTTCCARCTARTRGG